VSNRRLHTLSWLAGVSGLALVVWYIQPTEFLRMSRSVGAAGAIGWLVLMLAARLLLTEVTILPIRAFGHSLRRSEAFWIGWVRTFSNQVFPFSGLAFYAHRLRQSSGISWTELAALSSTQLFLAAAGVGLIGILATSFNFSVIGNAAPPTLIAFGLVAAGSLLLANRPAQLINSFPKPIRLRVRSFVEPAGHLAQYPGLIRTLTMVQCAAVLLHGGRLWLLFFAVGIGLSWHEALLILVIAEAASLLQITPGGLGLREGAIVGAAMLLQISPEVAASVALLDRLLTIAITTLLAAPAVVQIYRGRTA
jgi:uncharacterized membrane protein YbhN (UPF0104 family)